MRIPSGDLAPARRHRRFGSGSSRRRPGRTAAVVLALVAVVGGGTYLLQRDDSKVTDRLATGPAPRSSTSAAPAATCAPPVARTPVITLQPRQVRVVLLNGTARNGLGKAIGDQLATRGFQVQVAGNAPPLTGASRVVWGAGAEPGAQAVSRYVLGSTVVRDARAPRGTLQLVLGAGFQRLRTPGEIAALRAVKPAPQPSPTCR